MSAVRFNFYGEIVKIIIFCANAEKGSTFQAKIGIQRKLNILIGKTI